ncbi:MAG: hypothetical protein ED557_08770 [Balneola sp.]|nr:MAG: hypothetical protein ED557_08770 [Balneola sp.]
MQKGFLNNREVILKFIKRAITDSDRLNDQVVTFERGDILFKQGDKLEFLYLLLEGTVTLKRKNDSGISNDLITLEPGHFIGIMAFTTGKHSLTTGSSNSTCKALKINQAEFEQYMSDNPRLAHPLQQLMLGNLADRFTKNLVLESELRALNKKLGEEGEQLKIAYQKLIHQEKMATLGELVAGFAHEVNNPASALLRSSEYLIKTFSDQSKDDTSAQLFLLGLNHNPMSSPEVRDRLKEIVQRFPQITDRATQRKLSQMPEEALNVIESTKDNSKIGELIQQFEAGKFIHNIEVASKRIANLVKSLKSYSRQEGNEFEYTDVREGINDTILLLTNRLKFLELQLELKPIPKVYAKPGALNQVWTNIIVNACDVLEHGERLSILAQQVDDKKIEVIISDSGPGIPEQALNKIFEPNFTTKNQGANFGLGLGLAISKEIIQEHGGTIAARNGSEEGAEFRVLLPITNY